MATVSNVSKYYRQLKKLMEQYPGIHNLEVMTHFCINGKRVLSYHVSQGGSEICATITDLAREYDVLYDSVVLSCERMY